MIHKRRQVLSVKKRISKQMKTMSSVRPMQEKSKATIFRMRFDQCRLETSSVFKFHPRTRTSDAFIIILFCFWFDRGARALSEKE